MRNNIFIYAISIVIVLALIFLLVYGGMWLKQRFNQVTSNAAMNINQVETTDLVCVTAQYMESISIDCVRKSNDSW